jgi:hypothetical protein
LRYVFSLLLSYTFPASLNLLGCRYSTTSSDPSRASLPLSRRSTTSLSSIASLQPSRLMQSLPHRWPTTGTVAAVLRRRRRSLLTHLRVQRQQEVQRRQHQLGRVRQLVGGGAEMGRQGRVILDIDDLGSMVLLNYLEELTYSSPTYIVSGDCWCHR